MLFYHVFGLILKASQSIPGLIPLKEEVPADIHIDMGGEWPLGLRDLPRLLVYESPKDNDGNFLIIWKLDNGSFFRFQYGDGTIFIIEGSGERVWAKWAHPLTVEDMTTYLLGPILGFILRLKGVVCLHASSIAVNNQAIAFLAPAGYGKSTLAAAFARLGYPVLTDDITTLVAHGDRFMVQPAYPRLRLWPQSVEILFGKEIVLPRISPQHPTWNKCYLDLTNDGYKFQEIPLPLSAIYTGEQTKGLKKLRIEALSSHVGLLTLIRNSYSCNLLDKNMRLQEFDLFNRLTADVPLRCIRVNSKADLPLPSNLCHLIIEDFQASHILNISVEA